MMILWSALMGETGAAYRMLVGDLLREVTIMTKK
jgi:hypothetical protein